MNTTVIIYRVETAKPVKGYGTEYPGPFTGPNSHLTYEQYSDHFNRMPAAQWDIDVLGGIADMLCAFPSLERLQYWMKHSRVPGSLQRHGYVIREFKVPAEHVVQGKSGHQCVFRREHAEVVATHKPKELLV